MAGSPGTVVAPGTLDVRGRLPEPIRITLPTASVNGLLGTELSTQDIAALLGPIGFDAVPAGADALEVTAPTNRPDVRPAPQGVADLAEEVARTYGYARIERRQPTWPEPGGLTATQRDRRRLRDVLVGVGGSEAWTASLVGEDEDRRVGRTEPLIGITNPMASHEAYLRGSQMPGLLRAVSWNLDRRQDDIRLFEVGVVFHPPAGGAESGQRAGTGGSSTAMLPNERELASAVFAADDDDAATAVAALRAVSEELGLVGLKVRAPAEGAPLPGLHPTRSARIVSATGGTVVGTVGEVDPAVAAGFGITERRLGWLEFDLGLLLDPAVVERTSGRARPVSRYPSSDVDLALVVDDALAADEVADVLAAAGGRSRRIGLALRRLPWPRRPRRTA